MNHDLYVLGDGDRVRERMEAFLLAGDTEGMRKLSGAITTAVGEMAASSRSLMSADVVVAGGDDLLLRLNSRGFSEATLHGLGIQFMNSTGCSISFGVGATLEDAYLNLRRAKAKGGATIVVSKDA